MTRKTVISSNIIQRIYIGQNLDVDEYTLKKQNHVQRSLVRNLFFIAFKNALNNKKQIHVFFNFNIEKKETFKYEEKAEALDG